MRALCSLLFSCLLALPARGDEPPPPLAGWRDEALPHSPLPEPRVLPEDPYRDVEALSARLIEAGSWDRLATFLRGRTLDLALRSRTIRARGGPRGCWPDAWQRLERWPAARAEVQKRLDAEAIELLRRALDPYAARREVVARLPLSAQAPLAAHWLAERALESGHGEAAAAWWRATLRLNPAPALAALVRRRLLGLRARPTQEVDLAGHWGVPQAPRAPMRVRWVRHSQGGTAGAPPVRAVAADARAVFLVERGHLVACARGDGRVRWAAPVAGACLMLRVAAETVLWVGPRSLRAFDRDDGALRWEWRVPQRDLEPGEGFRAAQPTQAGWIVSLERAGRWEILGLGARGERRWATRLWDTQRPLSQAVAWSEEGPPYVRRASRVRRVLGDGALAVLADQLAITATGRVAVLGVEQGDLRWTRPRSFGRSLDRGPTHVDVRLGAWGLDAYTSHGLLVRFDPRTGASLPLPQPRAKQGYLLTLRPLTLQWGDEVRGGVEGRALGTLSPIWRGGVCGRVLALPATSGLELRDALSGRSWGTQAWPLGPARVVEVSGGLVLANREGVSLLELDDAEPSTPAAVPGTWLGFAQALGDSDWRRRAAAWASLRGAFKAQPRAAEAVRALLPQLADPETRREATWGLAGLEANVGEERRWQIVLPGVEWRLVRRALSDLSGRALRKLGPKVALGPAVALELRLAIRNTRTWPQRLAHLELMLRADPRLEGPLVALVKNHGEPGVRRAGMDELVRLAANGGSRRGLRLVLKDATRRDVEMFASLATWGDAKLWEDVRPKEMDKVAFQMFQALALPKETEPDPEALWEALGEALAPR